MRKFLIAAAAGLTVVVTGSLIAPRADAITLAPLPTGMTNQLNMVEQVALCFYVDGWNGPGMYECGYRHRRGYGWHGPRDDRPREYDRRYREYDRGYRGGSYDERRRQCPQGYSVQDGVCKPYRGY